METLTTCLGQKFITCFNENIWNLFEMEWKHSQLFSNVLDKFTTILEWKHSQLVWNGKIHKLFSMKWKH